MPPSSKRILAWLCALLVLAAAGTYLILLPPHASPQDAFLGDSLTENWHYPRSNFGIHGQTSAQILARFPSQIPGKGYRRVFILAGTNDTLLGIDPDVTIANLGTMADLASLNHIEPVLAEIPPIYRDRDRFAPHVLELNRRIAALAAAKHIPLVDYYTPLNGHPNGYIDGIHMRERNYLRMEWAQRHPVN